MLKILRSKRSEPLRKRTLAPRLAAVIGVGLLLAFAQAVARPSNAGAQDRLGAASLGAVSLGEQTSSSTQKLVADENGGGSEPGSRAAAGTLVAENTSEAMSRRVDALLEEKRQEQGWQAAELSSDAEFLRRCYLDLTGLPPSAAEVLEFLESDEPDKRGALVDRLLATSQSAAHLAATWAGWLLPEEANPFLGPNQNGLEDWFRDRFAENLRYDRLVADLLVASGPARSGPASFFVAHEGKPEKIAARTARVFMGVQLDCAECHDHPFDQWSQRDFWGFAAYFAQMSTSADAVMMQAGEVGDTGEGDVVLPGTEEIVAPQPLVKTGFSQLSRGTRRQQLTLWLTTRENPYLARATVNRVWSLLFGRGLIEPIDDMRSLEMASHPKLLRELSDYFASTGYDLRDLISMLAKTEAYGLATQHLSGHVPPESYAAMETKPLTSAQLAGSLAQVAREVMGPDAAAQASLAGQLGKLRGDASEAKLGIVSALVTLHGGEFERVANENSSRLLKALEAPFFDGRKQLKWMFLATLNRLPRAEEEAAFSELITAAEQEDNPTWKSDLLWALVNSTEFAMTP